MKIIKSFTILISMLIALYFILRRFFSFADPITDKIHDTMNIANKDNATLIYEAAYQRLLRHFNSVQSAKLANLMVAQSKYETANYTSHVFKVNNNAFGYKYYKGSLYQNGAGIMSNEGNLYGVYANVSDSAREVADWIGRRLLSFNNVNDVSTYANALKKNDYYGQSSVEYSDGMKVFLV